MPVRISLLALVYVFNSRMSLTLAIVARSDRKVGTHLQSRFFSRWPSSTTIYFQLKPERYWRSFMQIS